MSDFVGKKAPHIALPDENGKIHDLKDYMGKWVLVYFYPKDMTPGCTIEAQCMRDRMNELKALGVNVFGVSADDMESHKKFIAKDNLNFPLLADVDKKAAEAYGVWQEKSFMGKKYMGISRESFLINPDGVVVKHYEKVTPKEHAEEVINDVKGMK